MQGFRLGHDPAWRPRQHAWRTSRKRLALLRAVEAVETDAFRVLVVQDFEGIAFEDGDDGAGGLTL
jgi:hypothetical protein